MDKPSKVETVLYLVVGIMPLLGYYLLLTEYFKVNPFRGYYLIPTIYLIICYILFSTAGRILNEKIEESVQGKPIDWILIPQTKLLISFIFGPFILIFR